MNKNIHHVLIALLLIISCSTLPPVLAGQHIESSVPEEIKGTELFYIREINYLHDNPLDIFNRDLGWFVDTELPSMLEVIGSKYDLSVTRKEKPSFLMEENALGLNLWIHEMKKPNSVQKTNAVSVILTLTNDKDESVGKIMFIDQTGNSIINIDYTYAVLDRMIKILANG